MKVNWKKHEIITITVLAVIGISECLWNACKLSQEEIKMSYAKPFLENNLTFSYLRNILLPQIGSLILFYCSYLWINLFTFPKLLSVKNKTVASFASVALQLLLIAFLLALGVNTISYYAHPHLINYQGFCLLALFGYNDHPLENLLQGFDAAIALTVIYMIFAAIREYISAKTENRNNRPSYQILIINQATMMLAVAIFLPAVPIAFDLINDDFIYIVYFTLIIPSILIYISNTYWLFPRTRSYLSLEFFGSLLLSTFILSFPTVSLITRHGTFWGAWNGIWAVQLMLVTPISLLIYQQGKDKILQLKGIEKALTRSKADLQFLKSQINPHFLFNVLNTLYGTALLDGSTRAAEGIQKLGEMMRFMLHENHMDYIPMSSEINYLKNYIAIQKLRVQGANDVVIEDSINDSNCTHLIAPMILIPFVENAFKHGINSTQKSWIRIKLECNKSKVRFQVNNSIHPAMENDPEKDRSGIGLENVKERLKILYRDNHQLTYGVDGEEFKAMLIIKPTQTY